MKKRKFILPSIALALVAAFGLVACGNKPAGGSQGGGDQSEISLGEITITAAGNKTDLLVGETVQLTASVEGVTWKSRSDAVATVDSTGLVTATGAGSVKIRAEKDGYGTGSITINVSKAPEREAKYRLGLEQADHIPGMDDGWGAYFYGTWYSGPFDTPVENNNGATADGTSIGNLYTGCKEILTFTSDKAVTVGIGISMAYAQEVDLAAALSITFNGSAIDLTGKVCEGPEDENTQNYYDFHGVELGDVALKAENNVLEIELIGNSGVNMDDVLIYTNETLALSIVAPAAKPQIEVTPTEKELEVGDTVQLVTATTGVSYASDKPEVASVSETGLVTALSLGKANISVSKEGMKRAKVVITVKAKAIEGQIVLEAEDAILPDDTSIQVESHDNCSGGKSIGYFSAGQTFSLEYTATAAEAKEYKLSIVAAACELDMSTYAINDMDLGANMSLKLGTTNIDLTGKTLPGNSSFNFANFKEVELGNVTLAAGKNTFTFEAIGQGPNIDCIKLTDPNASTGPVTTVKYTVTFVAGEGATGTMDPVEVEEGTEYALPTCSFTAPANSHFAGWSIPSANWWESAQIKQPGDKITVNANVTVTATWLKDNVTITFAAGDGTGTMAPVSMAPGEYTLPDCTFTAPANKVFAGWAIVTVNQWGMSQTQIKQAGEKITVSDDMTITATWKIVIVKDTQIDLTDAFVFEAENATPTATGQQCVTEDNEGSHGGKDVGYMSAGAALTFNFNSSAAGKAKLILMGRSASADWSQYPNVTYYDQALEDTTSIKVNGVDVSLTAKGFLGSDGKTSVQVDLGEVDIASGPNTIVITAIQQAPNFDCIALIGSMTFSIVA